MKNLPMDYIFIWQELNNVRNHLSSSCDNKAWCYERLNSIMENWLDSKGRLKKERGQISKLERSLSALSKRAQGIIEQLCFNEDASTMSVQNILNKVRIKILNGEIDLMKLRGCSSATEKEIFMWCGGYIQKCPFCKREVNKKMDY